MTEKVAMGPRGFSKDPIFVRIKNVTAAVMARGEVVQLDLAITDGDTLNLVMDKEGSGYFNAVAPQAGASGVAAALSKFVCIWAGAGSADIPAGGEGLAVLRGQARVRLIESGGSTVSVAGEEATVDVSKTANITQVAANRVVARVEQNGVTQPVGAPGALVLCWFEGEYPTIK